MFEIRENEGTVKPWHLNFSDHHKRNGTTLVSVTFNFQWVSARLQKEGDVPPLQRRRKVSSTVSWMCVHDLVSSNTRELRPGGGRWGTSSSGTSSEQEGVLGSGQDRPSVHCNATKANSYFSKFSTFHRARVKS